MADQERLALYLMGALDDAERESFEAHLADCWHCLDEAAEIGPSISGLAGLDDVDWSLPTDDPLLSEPSTDAGTTPPASGISASGAAASTGALGATPAVSADAPSPGTGDLQRSDDPDSAAAADDAAITRQRGDVSGAGPARPAGSRPAGRRTSGTRPGTTAGSWRRRRALWAGAAAVVLALAGGVVAVNEWTGRTDPVLTATGEAPGYGAGLSVVITAGEQGSATIRITATGLRQGTRYRLFAVTRDGATHVVRDWTATSGPQEVAGETSLPVDELSFITVGLTDGSAIVTAPIARNPASPR
ncbi:zf-HC2 domain-containing protein [Micromonospora sp. NPDC051196]|uniref:zf-HC2 domain-containing protein n=1 Tax=Micromonospora sp. NPDC051196 TaxID=3155281 RepID=UPI00343F34A6